MPIQLSEKARKVLERNYLQRDASGTDHLYLATQGKVLVADMRPGETAAGPQLLIDDLPDGRQRIIYAGGLRNPIGSLKEDSLCQRGERQASLEPSPIFVCPSPIGSIMLRGGG
jgi:hypothetical protein